MDPLRSDDAADDPLELNPKGRRRRRRRYSQMQIALAQRQSTRPISGRPESRDLHGVLKISHW